MEFLIAILFSVFAAGFALQLAGSDRIARLIVGSAMTHLPRPIRDRVTEECRSEIEEMQGPWPKFYIVFTCFLDAVRLERLWRTKQLRNMADNGQAAPDDSLGGRSRRLSDDSNRLPDAKEDRNLPKKASQRSLAAVLKFRSSLLLRANAYKPQYRTRQKLLFGCGGKVYRLDGGIWVNDW